MSVLGQTHAAPVCAAVMSLPSNWYWFSLTLAPNAEARDALLSNRAVETPGVMYARSKNVKRAVGVDSTSSDETVVVMADRDVSISGDSPLTVTDSSIAPTVSLKSTSNWLFASTRIPSRRIVWNPASVAVRVYTPGASPGKRYWPLVIGDRRLRAPDERRAGQFHRHPRQHRAASNRSPCRAGRR